jgi:hypothetical protein
LSVSFIVSLSPNDDYINTLFFSVLWRNNSTSETLLKVRNYIISICFIIGIAAFCGSKGQKKMQNIRKLKPAATIVMRFIFIACHPELVSGSY